MFDYKQVVEQLGGVGKLTAMVGAYHMGYTEDSFSFKFKGCRKANYMKITLTPMDLCGHYERCLCRQSNWIF